MKKTILIRKVGKQGFFSFFHEFPILSVLKIRFTTVPRLVGAVPFPIPSGQ